MKKIRPKGHSLGESRPSVLVLFLFLDAASVFRACVNALEGRLVEKHSGSLRLRFALRFAA